MFFNRTPSLKFHPIFMLPPWAVTEILHDLCRDQLWLSSVDGSFDLKNLPSGLLQPHLEVFTRSLTSKVARLQFLLQCKIYLFYLGITLLPLKFFFFFINLFTCLLQTHIIASFPPLSPIPPSQPPPPLLPHHLLLREKKDIPPMCITLPWSIQSQHNLVHLLPPRPHKGTQLKKGIQRQSTELETAHSNCQGIHMKKKQLHIWYKCAGGLSLYQSKYALWLVIQYM